MAGRAVYVHIGAPKTGSTEVQRWCAANRDALGEAGVLYPSAALRGFGHHDIAFLLDGGYPEWATPGPAELAPLVDALSSEAASAARVILSSENFYLFPQPEALARLIDRAGLSEGRPIRIVCYVRRQDRAIESWYNQMVKAQGFAGSLRDAMSGMGDLWDYAARLDRWSKAFGAENVMVRRYRESVAFDALSDFLGVLGVDPPTVREPRSNISLNRDILEIQRVLNRLPIGIVDKRAFHRELMELTKAAPEGFSQAPVLSAAERREIMARYEGSNGRLAERFFDGDSVFEPISAEAIEDVLYPGLSVEAVVSTLGWLLLKRREGA